MRTQLDHAIEQLESQLASLPKRLFAVFFAACGERLFPLYQSFAEKECWGDPKTLRNALEAVWLCLEGGPHPPVDTLIGELEKITPHGDDFDAPDSTFAQDASICVDAALRAIDGNADPRWVEYPIESIKTAVCMEETGLLDLGSGLRAESWENRVIDNPKMKSELEFFFQLIRHLREKNPMNPLDVSIFRKSIRGTEWTRSRLLSE